MTDGNRIYDESRDGNDAVGLGEFGIDGKDYLPVILILVNVCRIEGLVFVSLNIFLFLSFVEKPLC